MIARTESKLASAVGQDLAWQQAIDRGLIDPRVAVVIWFTSRDEVTCPICWPMDRQERKVGEPFLAGDGRRVLVPTDTHPQCRCTRAMRVAGARATGSLGSVIGQLTAREHRHAA